MKITKIELKDFHQFKDLTIDLTYPKGHDKEGQPLDKVCFIGQSGTGKTSLLELIPKFLFDYDTNLTKNSYEDSLNNIICHIKFGKEYNYQGKFIVRHILQEEKSLLESLRSVHSHNFEEKYETKNRFIGLMYDLKFLEEWLSFSSSKMIYFPANLNYEIEVDAESKIEKNKIIDFSKEKISSIWHLILDKIQSYQEQELQIRQEISKTVEQASNNLDIIKLALKNLEDWKKTEFNPIQDIADNCLNHLLEPFKLRVKTELDIKSKDDLGFIKLEDYNANEIPNGLWSTGTKQVVLSAMPLYLLKPKHTIILFDEPERSLYPDLQRFVIDFYTSLTENCQFFYSTHSPIIASNFEPWEIVELKFDKEGHVYRELYYEGENHVDNYKYNPRYMRWDDILQRIFDMENDGSPLRKEKLDELATYNVKYKKLTKQNKQETEEGVSILKEIQKLSKELSTWEN